MAMDHKNVYDHTALQTVHKTKNKSRASFIQKDNLIAVCQVICKSLSA